MTDVDKIKNDQDCHSEPEERNLASDPPETQPKSSSNKRKTKKAIIISLILIFLIINSWIIHNWFGYWVLQVYYSSENNSLEKPCEWVLNKFPLFLVGRGLLQEPGNYRQAVLIYERGENGRKFLAAQLGSGGRNVRVTVLKLLREISIGGEDISFAYPLIIDLLKSDNDPIIRENAADALFRLNDEYRDQAVNVLIYAFRSDKTDSVRYVSFLNLHHQLYDERMTPYFEEALNDPFPPIKAEAAYELAYSSVESEKINQTLCALLMKPDQDKTMNWRDVYGFPVVYDVDDEVRENAALALGMIGDESVLPVLQEALQKEKNAKVREQIQKAINEYTIMVKP